MIKLIQDILAKQQYSRIASNISYVTLYVKYVESGARVIQLIDCEHGIEMTPNMYIAFSNKAKEFIKLKGYEVDFLSVISTPYTGEARRYILDNNETWIVDSDEAKLFIYDNQPDDFYGLRDQIETVFKTLRPEDTKMVDAYIENDYGTANSTYNNLRKIVTLVNTIIVLINVVVFFVLSVNGSTEDIEFMVKHGAMFAPAITQLHEYYRLFTSMFLHFGFEHLVGNMLTLMLLGDNVERAVGKIKYLIIYIGGGLIGSLGSFLYALVYNKGIVSAGASGAIFAIVGALLWLVVCNKGKLEDLTTYRLCVLIFYSLYSGLTSEHVDNAAHICGLLGGFLIAFLIYRKPKNNI